MKKLKFILLCLILLPEVHSQTEWFPIGAEWYYEWGIGTFDSAPVFCKRYFVEKDTVVAEKTCRLISGENSKDILYEENGIVYYYFNNKFRKIYDFTVIEGDVVELELKMSSGSDYQVMDSTMIVACTIEKIQSKFINGVELKEIYASYSIPYEISPDNWYTEWGAFWYLEKVGCEYPGTLNRLLLGNEFIPYISHSVNTPEVFHRLRCYHDSDIEYITDRFQSLNKPCDYDITEPASNIKIYNMKEEIIIYPNPVKDRLTVSGVNLLKTHEVKIFLYDSVGKVIFEKKESIPCELNIGNLASGIYYMHVLNNSILLTSKLLKL